MIQCEGLVKIYKSDDLEVVALQGLNLNVREGEMMAIIGNSGSGKSTLLNILGGLDRPSAGSGQSRSMGFAQNYRRSAGGVQTGNSRLHLAEQCAQPAALFDSTGKCRNADDAFLRSWIEPMRSSCWNGLDLKERMHNKLHQLSGGEQQRVAIAISLSNRPKLLLADEPTGSVDTQTSDMIMDIFRRLNQEIGVTIVIVTHDCRSPARWTVSSRSETA